MLLDEFYTGASFDAHSYFGAHEENTGFAFRVFAPGAEKVELIGDWNDWIGAKMEGGSGAVWRRMQKRGSSINSVFIRRMDVCSTRRIPMRFPRSCGRRRPHGW